ncbi:uncharacterized protein LOC123675342 [Harmonia axyridis]|uniref:uncharacterized protein LOC123675342 n=1 Tax=Harmonia axyridis TaxID=115357 RepID=UPI001E2750A4|nr:uncharacterized protein LOC123675342 [Harmonia axyridis]
MYAKLKKNPNNEELEIKHSEMKKQLRKTILRAKQEYFEKCVEDNQNETEALWRYVQNSSKKETQITSIRTKENRVVEDEQEISDIFNDYFSGIGERYANEITEPAEFREEKIHSQESFFLFPTDSEEIEKVISSLKSRKSTGHDGIRSEVLKQVKHEISEPIAYLVNNCFEKACFPDILKIGTIKPLHKGEDKTQVNNNRPVTLISNVAKIFEKFEWLLL